VLPHPFHDLVSWHVLAGKQPSSEISSELYICGLGLLGGQLVSNFIAQTIEARQPLIVTFTKVTRASEPGDQLPELDGRSGVRLRRSDIRRIGFDSAF